jgi:hypothetical protein
MKPLQCQRRIHGAFVAEPITGTIIASAAPSFILPALAQQALPPGARRLEHLNRHWACNLNLNAD